MLNHTYEIDVLDTASREIMGGNKIASLFEIAFAIFLAKLFYDLVYLNATARPAAQAAQPVVQVAQPVVQVAQPVVQAAQAAQATQAAQAAQAAQPTVQQVAQQVVQPTVQQAMQDAQRAVQQAMQDAQRAMPQAQNWSCIDIYRDHMDLVFDKQHGVGHVNIGFTQHAVPTCEISWNNVTNHYSNSDEDHDMDYEVENDDQPPPYAP